MIPSTVRIFVCTAPMDMRRSFDGLACAVETVAHKDPRSGALFAFINKRHNRLKILWWDKNGYCLLSKRLHRAVFMLPNHGEQGGTVAITASMLAALIAGVSTQKKTKAQRMNRDIALTSAP